MHYLLSTFHVFVSTRKYVFSCIVAFDFFLSNCEVHIQFKQKLGPPG